MSAFKFKSIMSVCGFVDCGGMPCKGCPGLENDGIKHPKVAPEHAAKWWRERWDFEKGMSKAEVERLKKLEEEKKRKAHAEKRCALTRYPMLWKIDSEIGFITRTTMRKKGAMVTPDIAIYLGRAEKVVFFEELMEKYGTLGSVPFESMTYHGARLVPVNISSHFNIALCGLDPVK